MEVEFSRFCQGMVGGVDGCLLHLRPASYCSTTEGIRGIGLFFSFAVLDLVFLRAELEESLHCLLVRRRPLSPDLGGMDQAHNASGHACHVFSFVALQPSVVPFGWKIDSQGNQGGSGKTSDDDRSFRLLGLDRVGGGQFTLGFPWCPFGYAMGASASCKRFLDRGMERVLFSRVFNLTIASYLPSLLIRRNARVGRFLFALIFTLDPAFCSHGVAFLLFDGHLENSRDSNAQSWNLSTFSNGQMAKRKRCRHKEIFDKANEVSA